VAQATIARLPTKRVLVGAGAAVAVLLLALILFLTVGGGGNKRKPPSGVVPAQNVVGSIGVNVHLSYGDTTYSRFPVLMASLKALGVRNLRDGACAGCVQSNQRMQQLGRAGFRFDLIMGDPKNSTGTLQQNLASVKQLAPFVTSVEGPNEWDNSGDPRWKANDLSYQRQLYNAVKDDPKLRRIQVIGPSLVNSTSFAKLSGIGSSLDAVNLHSYPPDGSPPASNVSEELRLAASEAPRKPVVSTETGYRTGGPPLPGNKPVNKKLEGAYLDSLVLEYYRAGIRRSYIYELIDERPDPAGKNPQEHFGLLNADTHPKPAFSALRNLIKLLSVGGPAGATALEPAHVTATTLDGSPIHTLTMQRGDGSQVLAVWETSPGGRPHPLELTVDQSASLSIYRPSVARVVQRRLGPVTDARINLGADPVLVVTGPGA
jgi:hypothetical protein